MRAGKNFKKQWNGGTLEQQNIYLSTLLIFSTMNTSQIRFVLTTNATWAVLRDPVLTLIYTRKMKRAHTKLRKSITPNTKLPTLFGYVFRLMYAECQKYV